MTHTEFLKERLEDYNIRPVWLEETDSTNNVSTKLALEGEDNLVIADIQTKGSGRAGRSFLSPKGGLYESVGFCINDIFPENEEPDINRTLHFPLLAALSAMNAIESVCEKMFGTAIIPDIKWPNDLQIKGKKIAGILCKAAQNHGKWYIIAGVGINIYNELPEELAEASVLADIIGLDKNDHETCEKFREELAVELFINIYDNFKNGIRRSGELLDEVEAHCITIGKKVEVPERGVKGTAIQIGDDGALCIKTGPDEYEIVRSGDVVIYM